MLTTARERLREIISPLSKLKPTWLSWGVILCLISQVMLACLVLYVTVANWLGIIKPLPDAQPHGLKLELAMLSIVAVGLVAAYGILRNRWWGFFAELAILWGLPLTIYVETHRVPILFTPFGFRDEWVVLALNYLLFGFWSFELVKRGQARFHEVRAETNA